MKDLIAGIKYDASKVISRAIGPSKEFCMGYMNPDMPDGGGYISTMKLSVGTVDIKGLDVVTESILAYDRCGRSDAYFGQVNAEYLFCILRTEWGDMGIGSCRTRRYCFWKGSSYVHATASFRKRDPRV